MKRGQGLQASHKKDSLLKTLYNKANTIKMKTHLKTPL